MKKPALPCAVLTLLFVSCAATQPSVGREDKPTPPTRPVSKATVQLTIEEQQKQSLDLFNKILELSQENDRSTVLDKMSEIYFQIIDQYPDAPLAQESYWRLVEIYLKDYRPPRKEEALLLYQELKNRYPDSPLKDPVQSSISRFFYTNQMWNDLIAFERPYVEEFIKSGKLANPTHLFLFSEAKLNLKDVKEAYKGYKIVLKFFPQSSEAKIAQERMKTIGTQEDK